MYVLAKTLDRVFSHENDFHDYFRNHLPAVIFSDILEPNVAVYFNFGHLLYSLGPGITVSSYISHFLRLYPYILVPFLNYTKILAFFRNETISWTPNKRKVGLFLGIEDIW